MCQALMAIVVTHLSREISIFRWNDFKFSGDVRGGSPLQRTGRQTSLFASLSPRAATRKRMCRTNSLFAVVVLVGFSQINRAHLRPPRKIHSREKGPAEAHSALAPFSLLGRTLVKSFVARWVSDGRRCSVRAFVYSTCITGAKPAQRRLSCREDAATAACTHSPARSPSDNHWRNDIYFLYFRHG
jgi:hypothetical protein